MTSWMKKAVTTAVVGSGLLAIMNCGGAIPGVGKLPGAAACPDMSSPGDISAFDWAGNYKVDGKVDAQLKAGVAAAVELQNLATSIDNDLKTACGSIVADLGGSNSFSTGEEACNAAAKAITDIKAKIGPKLKLTVDAAPPKCSVDVNAQADCAAKCDVSATPGSVKAECEPGKLQGECSAQCEGSCDVSGGAKCDGNCSGKCDAQMTGSCGGTCDGKCDGKAFKGSCSGKCDGKCDAEIKGSCGGSCSGSCELKAKAECKGTCTGGCSVEMKAPKCTGKVTPPKVSADCNAHCSASVSAKAECTPAHVLVRIEGGPDLAMMGRLKTALEHGLPGILKVALAMADRLKNVAESVKTVIEGAQAAVQAVASGAPQLGAQLTACVGAPFKGALDAAGSMKADVNVSVSVSASATASSGGGGGSAGGGAGAGGGASVGH
ncbi:hypothetical protein BH09MYX1_BH09MYX1_50520 [soil metagenome]